MEVNGKAALVKGKVDGNGRKGQSRGEICLGRGREVGGAYRRERKQGRSYRHRRPNKMGRACQEGLRGPTKVVYG